MSGEGHEQHLTCADPECSWTIPDHRWARTKAHSAGAFEQKDGTIWCPEHIPDWVGAWRAKQAAKQKAKKEQS